MESRREKFEFATSLAVIFASASYAGLIFGDSSIAFGFEGSIDPLKRIRQA